MIITNIISKIYYKLMSSTMNQYISEINAN